MSTHLAGRLVGWTSAMLILVAAADLRAQSTPTRVVFDPQQFEQLAIKPSSAQVKTELSRDAAAPGIVLSAASGPDGYPGIELTPKTGTAWDLSPFGHVAATVTNLGAKPVGVHLRIDNDADWQLGPSNSESVYLAPGKSGTITIIFGYSYGKKPSYPLKSSAVVRMLVFLNKSAEAQSIRIESIMAAGPAGEKPPVDPASIRIKPTDGYLFGGAASFEHTHQVIAKDGAEFAAANNGKSLRLRFSKPGQSVTLKSTQGAWDLRTGNQVRVKIKNVGTVAAFADRARDQCAGPDRQGRPAGRARAGAIDRDRRFVHSGGAVDRHQGRGQDRMEPDGRDRHEVHQRRGDRRDVLRRKQRRSDCERHRRLRSRIDRLGRAAGRRPRSGSADVRRSTASGRKRSKKSSTARRST